MRTRLRHLSHRRCRASLFLTLWILLVAGAAEALTAAEKLDRTIPRVMKGRRIPGVAALVVRNGAIVWEREYGLADVANQIPVAADTMFMLASVSKTVTAVAMLALVDDGAVALDDPIDAYLPFPVRNPNFPATPITVRMLLTHTSSIADGPQSFDSYVQGDSPIPLETFLNGYVTPGGATYDPDNFLDTAPGERYEYSNEGTALLGLLVQRISTQTFEDFCASRIFQPLGMTDTAWRLTGLDVARVALPYHYDSGDFVSYGHYGYPDIPNGALRTPAAQLAKFLMMFMNGGTYNGTAILQSATVAAMVAPQIPDLDPNQGLIWYHRRIGGHHMIGHNGGDDGVSTDMFYEPSTGIGIIVLVNQDDGADTILRRILRYAPRL